MASFGFASDITVEAFEEPIAIDSPSDELQLPVADDEEEDDRPAMMISGASSAAAVRPPRRSSNWDTAKPATFTAQMDAVERDLADLAGRVQTPAAPDAVAADPQAPATPEEAEAAAAAPPVKGRFDHRVFDDIAKGMSYATEFTLPSVQLSQVFSALDRQLDAESTERDRKSTPPAAAAPAPSATTPEEPAVPPTAVLLKDLIALQPNAAPVPAEPVSAAYAAPVIDIRHDVQLVPQLTGFSCWAAGAAMLVGWRDKMSVDPSEIARATGYWAQYANGLHAEDTQMFRVWRLTPEAAQTYTVEGFADLLRRHGPLWVASAEPGPHVRVVTGMVGDGTATGTLVHICDPWEQGMAAFRMPNHGSRYTETYQRFVDKQNTLGRQEMRLQGIYVAHN
jgi:hypothetical protein